MAYEFQKITDYSQNDYNQQNYQSWLKDKEKLSMINLKRFMTIEPGQQRTMKGICQTEGSNKHLQDVTVKNK